MKYPYLLFDLDGTLIDSHEAICRSLNDTLRHYGKKELPFSQAKKYIGTPLPEVIRQLGMPVPEGIDVYRPYYFSYLEKYQSPYDGIHKLLNSIHGQSQLSIATNKGRNGTNLSLMHAGIDAYFQLILTEADVNAPKPDPEMFHKTRSHFSGHDPLLSPGKFLMIGDSPVDGDFAFNSGIDFAFASWGFYEVEDLHRQPDYILKSPDDLLKLIDPAG